MKSGQGLILELIRGGQITIHYIRMAKQVFKIYMVFIFLVALSLFAFLFIKNTNGYERGYAFNYAYSYVCYEYMNGFNPGVVVFTPTSSPQRVTAKQVLGSVQLRNAYISVYQKSKHYLFISFLFWIALVISVSYIIKVAGRKQVENKKIRGGELVSSKKLARFIDDYIKKNKKTDESYGITSIANIKIPANIEVTNFLLIGDQGTGKSQTVIENLIRAREQGRKAVIFDPSGDTIRYFYNPETDYILNPIDERSSSWTIWGECKQEYQIQSLTEAFIEDSGNKNDFFVKAARIVFSTLIRRCDNIEELIETVSEITLEELAEYLVGTEASAIIDMDGAKAAHSVRAVLVSNITSLRYTTAMKGKSLSINDWVRDPEENGFLFISCPPPQMRMLKPLISIWIDTTLNAILSLEPDRQRRIITSIDEFASLNKLPVVSVFLSQARKYGNISFIGVQNYAQLKERYGADGALAIFGLCGTWVIFRSSENSNADWLSKNLYKEDLIEPNENNSFGANEIRDGVSLNRTRHQRELVTATEIQSLQDLTAFLRIGRGFPIALVEQEYRKLDPVAEGFCTIEEDPFRKQRPRVDRKNSDDTETEKPTEKQNAVDFTDIDI